MFWPLSPVVEGKCFLFWLSLYYDKVCCLCLSEGRVECLLDVQKEIATIISTQSSILQGAKSFGFL